jgi:hypothetical protein
MQIGTQKDAKAHADQNDDQRSERDIHGGQGKSPGRCRLTLFLRPSLSRARHSIEHRLKRAVIHSFDPYPQRKKLRSRAG